MITYSTPQIRRSYRSFWAFVFGLVLIFSLFQGFLPQIAEAYENAYVSDTLFYNDTTNGLVFQFHVKTTFSIYTGANRALAKVSGTGSDLYVYLAGYAWTMNQAAAFEPDLTANQFIAGNTYQFYLKETHDSTNNPMTKARVQYHIGHTLISTDFLRSYSSVYDYFGGHLDLSTILAYYSEVPTLTITYPENNDEIAENFYITGSFTQPTSTYQWLTTFVAPASGTSYINVFNQNINLATSGAVSIWVNGLAVGYYDFDIYMRDNESNFWPLGGWPITNIHIVEDLSYTLPPYGGQPPTTAPVVYEPLEPNTYYTANSDYSTSTALYNTMTGTFAPVLLAIGDSLTRFSSNFTQSNASSTGSQIGNSILLIRSYLSNINAFFADFPVGQFLLLYLVALVVVIVLRLVKGVIGLFKV